MNCCAETRLAVLGVCWAFANGTWRQALMRRCRTCNQFDMVSVQWVDSRHPCLCLSCLSQEVRYERDSGEAGEAWYCLACGSRTCILREGADD